MFMSNPDSLGIISNPVLFDRGVLLPARNADDMTDPQNIWQSMENAQEWNAARILGHVVHGLNLREPYFEIDINDDFDKKIAEADAQRNGTDRYTAARGALTLSAFMGVDHTTLLAEFTHKSALDIGSGDGVLANELRRFAGTHVTEIDFSAKAFASAPPIHDNLGERIVGNGTAMNFENGQFERAVMMFSTNVHTNTIGMRLKAFTEGMRVTAKNGRLIVAPLFGMTMLRQQRWVFLEQADQMPNLDLTPQELADFRRSDQQMAALEFATVGLIRKLMHEKVISLTPALLIVNEGGRQKDMINAVIDVHDHLSPDETNDLIKEQVAVFTKPN